MRRLPPLALVLLLSVGCASHPPTVTGEVQLATRPRVEGAVLDVWPSFYYMPELDGIDSAEPSGYEHDQQLTSWLVDTWRTSDVRIVSRKEDQQSDYACDYRFYQYVNWNRLVYLLLPIPYSANQSMCVAAELRRGQGAPIREYRECGYTRQRGFWLFTGLEEPPPAELRYWLVKQSLNRIVQDFRALAARAGE